MASDSTCSTVEKALMNTDQVLTPEMGGGGNYGSGVNGMRGGV